MLEYTRPAREDLVNKSYLRGASRAIHTIVQAQKDGTSELELCVNGCQLEYLCVDGRGYSYGFS